MLKHGKLRERAYLPSFHPSHNFGCGVDSAQGQCQIPSDLLETIPAEQLDGPGHAIQRHVLADKPVAETRGHHSSCNAKLGICVEFTKELLKMVFLQGDVGIDVPNKSVIKTLRLAEPTIKGADFVAEMPLLRLLQTDQLN